MEKQLCMLKLSDPDFQRTLTLEQAYMLLVQFVEQYNARGESSTLDLLGDISMTVWSDGGSGDPAQLSDFLRVADQVLGPVGHGT